MKDSYKFLLDQIHPRDYQPSQRWFYDNLAQPLIPIAVKIMMQGIKIDQDAVEELRDTVDDVLADVTRSLQENSIIKKFQAHRYDRLRASYIRDKESKQRSIEYYLSSYKPDDMVQRSFLLQEIVKTYTAVTYRPETMLPVGIPKWAISDVKALREEAHSPQFQRILDRIVTKSLNEDNQFVKQALRSLAVVKSSLYNRKYILDIENVSEDKILPPFNPGSSDQKRELFDFLGIPCEAFSKDTGLPSWNRDQVERVNKETDDPNIKSLTQAFIDHSFSAIIKDNFIAAFDKYTIDGTLYGNIKLGGAKSFRLTSNKP